jgi:CRISPR type III-A-associated protein Csm2
MGKKNEMKMSLDELKDRIEIADFFNEKKEIKKELINDVGKNNVKEVAEFINEPHEYFVNHKKFKDKKLTINQIRKFYDEFLNIFNTPKISMEEKKVRLLMLKANAEYSANRLEVKTLEIFMKNRLDIVLKQMNENDFNNYLRVFKFHFEALVGYFPKK